MKGTDKEMKDISELRDKMQNERPVAWDQLPDIPLYMGTFTG